MQLICLVGLWNVFFSPEGILKGLRIWEELKKVVMELVEITETVLGSVFYVLFRVLTTCKLDVFIFISYGSKEAYFIKGSLKTY